MKKIKILAVIILALLCATLPACKKTGSDLEKFSEYSFDYFDTVTTVTGYAASREEFDGIVGDVFSELKEYHRLFTIYLSYEGLNNLRTVNQLSDGEHDTVTVDRKIIDMLLYAKEMYGLTGGKMNIAMGSVLSILHEYRTCYNALQ